MKTVSGRRNEERDDRGAPAIPMPVIPTPAIPTPTIPTRIWMQGLGSCESFFCVQIESQIESAVRPGSSPVNAI